MSTANSLFTNAAMENISVADATTANILLTEHGVTILNVTTATGRASCLIPHSGVSRATPGGTGETRGTGSGRIVPSGAGGSDGFGVPAGRVTQSRQVSAEEPYDGCLTKRMGGGWKDSLGVWQPQNQSLTLLVGGRQF